MLSNLIILISGTATIASIKRCKIIKNLSTIKVSFAQFRSKQRKVGLQLIPQMFKMSNFIPITIKLFL